MSQNDALCASLCCSWPPPIWKPVLAAFSQSKGNGFEELLACVKPFHCFGPDMTGKEVVYNHPRKCRELPAWHHPPGIETLTCSSMESQLQYRDPNRLHIIFKVQVEI